MPLGGNAAGHERAPAGLTGNLCKLETAFSGAKKASVIGWRYLPIDLSREGGRSCGRSNLILI